MYKRNDNLYIMLKEYRWDKEPHRRYHEPKCFTESARWLILGYYKANEQVYYAPHKWFFHQHNSGLYSVVFADDVMNIRVSVKRATVKQAYIELNSLVRRVYRRAGESKDSERKGTRS